MSIDRSYPSAQGVLMTFPSTRTTDSIWDAESSFSEAGPTPGIPEPDSTRTRQVLQAQGQQAGDKTYEVRTQWGGDPEPGGGAYVWKLSTDPANGYRGQDQPNSISGQKIIDQEDTVALPDVRIDQGDVLVTSTGAIIVVYDRGLVTGAGTTLVKFARWDPDTRLWTTDGTVPDTAQVTRLPDGASPCLAEQEDGTILLYHFVSTTTEVQIRAHRSVDDGVTWTMIQPFAIRTSLLISAHTVRRVRVGALNGQVLLMVWTLVSGAENYIQYASANESSFTFIEAGAALAVFRFQDIVTTTAGIHVYYANAQPDQIQLKLIPDPFKPLSKYEEVTVYSNLQLIFSLEGDLTVWVDDSGTFYAGFRDYSTTSTPLATIARSFDGTTAGSFEELGAAATALRSDVWYRSGGINDHPMDLAGAYHRGRHLMLCRHDLQATGSQYGDYGQTLYLYELGGYSTVTLPDTKLFQSDDRQTSWYQVWTGTEAPSQVGWVFGGTAGDVTVLPDQGWQHKSTASTALWSEVPTTTVVEGLIVRAKVQVATGGSRVADDVSLNVRLDDGVSAYEVTLRFDTTGFVLFDTHLPGNIGAAATIDMTNAFYVDVMVALTSSDVRVWYRLIDMNTADALGPNTDRVWVEGQSGVPTDGGALATTNLISFGNRATTTSTSTWAQVMYAQGTWTALGLAQGQSNPDDLMPRTYAGLGLQNDLRDGLSITAVEGGTVRGDEWEIAPLFDFPIDAIFPAAEPSPRIPWRSKAATPIVQQIIALAFDQTLLGTANSDPTCDTIGLGLAGINWRTGTLEGYDAGGAGWVVLASIDTSDGLTLNSTRVGATIVPGVIAGTDAPYLTEQEYAGSIVELSSTVFREIRHHPGGVWDSAKGGRLGAIALKGVDGTEPASGVFRILPRNVVILVNLLGAQYAGYRLVIDSQRTLQGYAEIGAHVLGPAHIFGLRHSVGSSNSVMTPTDIHDLPDGSRRMVERRPVGRLVEWSFSDGVSISEQGGVIGELPDPDYAKLSTTAGALPVASSFGGPLDFPGLYAAVLGARHPVWLLRRIEQATDPSEDVKILNRAADIVYGIFTSEVIRTENIYGIPGEAEGGEIVRVGTVTLEELL